MILTVGGIKGGAGKSMITVNLTVIRALSKKKVLLVDADEQGTTGDWSEHRINLGNPTSWTTVRFKTNAIGTEILKMTPDYDDVIIDCGGRDTLSLRAALIISDVFLVPFQPRSFDIWTIEQVCKLIDEARIYNSKLIAYAFINCAGARGTDNEDAQSMLAKTKELTLLPVTIGQRKAFSNAAAEGWGVAEKKNDSKAESEMWDLHDHVFTTKSISI